VNSFKLPSGKDERFHRRLKLIWGKGSRFRGLARKKGKGSFLDKGAWANTKKRRKKIRRGEGKVPTGGKA